MNLQGGFYQIEFLESTATSANGRLVLDPSHKIFDGHFPGAPVVPGVCMMQMAKEILETVLQVNTRLLHADSLKFLRVVDPRQNPHLDFILSYQQGDTISMSADFMSGADICFRFKGSMIISAISPL